MKCKDCSHAEMCKWIDELEGRGCDFGEPCETSTDESMTMVYPIIFCDDAISREDVMDWLENATYDDVCEAIGTNLDFLPPVTPSRHKGHWIIQNNKSSNNFFHYNCDRCGWEIDSPYCLSYFCPNCGAEMEGR